jgi:hypothetical protein
MKGTEPVIEHDGLSPPRDPQLCAHSLPLCLPLAPGIKRSLGTHASSLGVAGIPGVDAAPAPASGNVMQSSTMSVGGGARRHAALLCYIKSRVAV